MIGVIAQRLMRLICVDCKAPASYSPETLAKVSLAPDPEIVFYRGRGCETCAGTRYQGRTGAFEVLVVDATINTLIRERSDAHQIRQAAVAAGMHTLLADALAKEIAGQTTIEEVIRVA
jgi:type II secretory ATPase GspE/PulE/Tfp pilus assembly ATPase PilB-like protein